MSEFTNKFKGRVKQAVGSLTGDEALKREGVRDEHKGEPQGKAADAKAAVRTTAEDARRAARETVVDAKDAVKAAVKDVKKAVN